MKLDQNALVRLERLLTAGESQAEGAGRVCVKFVGGVPESACRTGLPELFPTATQLVTSQRDDGVRAPNRPMHA